MENSRKYLIAFSVLLYILISLPFLFCSTLFDNHTLPIKILLVLFIFPFASKYKVLNNTKLFFKVFAIYFIIICLIRSNYFVNALLLAVDVVFFWECSKLLSNEDVYTTIKNGYIKFSIAIACIIVFSAFVYKYVPGLFSYREINGYKSYFNPLFGMIVGEKERPCWYFAEPSYCGFYLGLSFLLLYSDKHYKKSHIYILSVLFGAAVFYTASLGTYIYMSFTLISALIVQRYKKKKLFEIILYVSIIFVIIIIPKIEELNILQLYYDEPTSFLDRQERVNIANGLINSMSFDDILFGCGINYAAEKYGTGLSDAYHKMYCEYGFVYFIIIMSLIRKSVIKNFTAYTFILLSFISVIIHDSPIILLAYLLFYKQTNSVKII